MKKKRKQKFIIARGSRPDASVERAYRKELVGNISRINALLKEHVVPFLKENSLKNVTRDSVETYDGLIADFLRRFTLVSSALGFAESVASSKAEKFVESSIRRSELRNDNAAKRKAIEIPETSKMVAQSGMENLLDAYAEENASLITKMSDDYLKSIKQAVLDNYIDGKYVGNGGIMKEIQRISSVSKKRARLIARDQSNKLHGAVTKIRSQAAGSIGYEWNNVHDQRVRGNPSGLYPNVPKSRNHWDRQGKFYLWEANSNPPIAPDGKPFRQPPPDGGAGQAINCRCFSSPVWVG